MYIFFLFIPFTQLFHSPGIKDKILLYGKFIHGLYIFTSKISINRVRVNSVRQLIHTVCLIIPPTYFALGVWCYDEILIFYCFISYESFVAPKSHINATCCVQFNSFTVWSVPI